MDNFTQKKFSPPVTEEMVAQSWRERGFSCALFVDPPGQEWNNFVHRTNELVTVFEGKLQLTVDGKEMIAHAGDEIFIPKGAYHSVKNIHSDTTQWFYGYD